MKCIAKGICYEERRDEYEDNKAGIKKYATGISSHNIKSMQRLSGCGTQIAFMLTNMAALEKDLNMSSMEGLYI